MKNENPKFILIDAQAVLHRAWHALPELTDPKGRVVNAVYGFTALLLKLIKEKEPTYLAVAFDTKAPTFRHKEYKEYKAGREKQPQRFYDQIDLSKKILKAFNIDFFAQDGFEADDLIGAIIKQKKWIKEDLKGKDIIIIEDIVDTGMTLNFVLNHLASHNPASLRVCALLDKRVRRLIDVPLDYIGFETPDEFVVGYGLDYQGEYRNLPFIGALNPELIEEGHKNKKCPE